MGSRRTGGDRGCGPGARCASPLHLESGRQRCRRRVHGKGRARGATYRPANSPCHGSPRHRPVYAAVRVVAVHYLSVGEAVGAQELPDLVLMVVVLGAIRARVPALTRLVDAEQAGA